MTAKELSYKIVDFLKDIDPYGFADSLELDQDDEYVAKRLEAKLESGFPETHYLYESFIDFPFYEVLNENQRKELHEIFFEIAKIISNNKKNPVVKHKKRIDTAEPLLEERYPI